MSTFFRENCLVFLCGLPFFAINHDYFRYWVFVIFVATFITFGVINSRPYSLGLTSSSCKISESFIWISFLPLTIFVVVGPFAEDLRRSFPGHAFLGSLFVLMVACWVYTMVVKKSQPLEGLTRRSWAESNCNIAITVLVTPRNPVRPHHCFLFLVRLCPWLTPFWDLRAHALSIALMFLICIRRLPLMA